jgi:glycerol-3-phosphate acyltransferase PlsY
VELLSNINIQFYILAYLVGSIPFGLILAKLFAKVDIKKHGSGNIGATNVLRVVKERDPALAKKLGIATLALDALKGAVVLLMGKMAGVSVETLWAIAVLSVMGHCFSLYLFFEGGKGVATGFGVLLFMIPLAALAGLAVWAVSAKLIKISSLSSLLGLLAVVAASFIFYPDIPHSPIVIIALIILYKHSDNIFRLLTGKEGRVV